MSIYSSLFSVRVLICRTFIIVFIISGCSPISELYRSPSSADSSQIDYSVIYYIHADSDYLYHDTVGKPVSGNNQVLESAILVAKTAQNGEVIIYHQLPERKFLGLFPRNKSQMYHFKNGKLVSRLAYRHSDRHEAFLETETRLFNEYRTHFRNEHHRNYFLFYGHEIPEDQSGQYHRTLPNIAVHSKSFAAGIQKFLKPDDKRFNLVVLSSCNNGSPEMVKSLMPLSDVLLASPQNLHLSHIDSNNLRLMDINPEIPSVQLAHSMADQTYRRLETEIHTTITLTVYNLEVLKEYKSELQDVNNRNNIRNQEQFLSDNIDCSTFSFFVDKELYNGIRTWYKPSRFGRKLNESKPEHSGWGCKP